MDLDLVFTYVNQAVARSGYTVEEWVGSSLADHVPPERLAEMQALMRREVEKGPGKQGAVFEAEIRRKDGTAFPVEVHAQVVFDENGRPTAMQGVTRDISERRRHEAGLAHLVRVLRAIRNVNQLITHEREREALLRGICATLTETRGVRVGLDRPARRRGPVPRRRPVGARRLLPGLRRASPERRSARVLPSGAAGRHGGGDAGSCRRLPHLRAGLRAGG